MYRALKYGGVVDMKNICAGCNTEKEIYSSKLCAECLAEDILLKQHPHFKLGDMVMHRYGAVGLGFGRFILADDPTNKQYAISYGIDNIKKSDFILFKYADLRDFDVYENEDSITHFARGRAFVNAKKAGTEILTIPGKSTIHQNRGYALFMSSYIPSYSEMFFRFLSVWTNIGSEKHIEAIKTHGLTPIHRVSFCSAFLQESLF